jgi:uncharacterized lipoprotein YmbA
MSLRRVLIAAVVSAVALAGCGAGEKVSPQLAMRDAANSTVKSKQGTFTISIVGAESDLNSCPTRTAKASSSSAGATSR